MMLKKVNIDLPFMAPHLDLTLFDESIISETAVIVNIKNRMLLNIGLKLSEVTDRRK